MAQANTFQRRIWPMHEVDGDTSGYIEDSGRRTYTVWRDRDLGINTPELHASDPAVRQKAEAAKAFRLAWFRTHVACNIDRDSWPRLDGNLFADTVEIPYFLLDSHASDSFDRWLSIITCQAGHNLQIDLLAAGLAVPFKG